MKQIFSMFIVLFAFIFMGFSEKTLEEPTPTPIVVKRETGKDIKIKKVGDRFDEKGLRVYRLLATGDLLVVGAGQSEEHDLTDVYFLKTDKNGKNYGLNFMAGMRKI